MKVKSLTTIILIVIVTMSVLLISCTNPTIEVITAQEAFDLIQENDGNPDFVIVDVRTPEEFFDGHLENALNINYNSGTFNDDINKWDKNKKYIVYCRSGSRSAMAVSIMADLGFREVYDMGGITAWIVKGFTIIK
ncbi:rhodanese-like domain-containing protein [Chloroflexota bacterium]